MAAWKQIGEILKKQGKTAAWLSRETGIPATTIRSAIARDSSKLSYDSMMMICDALGITIGDLIPLNYDSFKARQKLNDDYFKKVCDMNGIKYEYLGNPESESGGRRTIILTVEGKEYRLTEGQYFRLIDEMLDASFEQLSEFLSEEVPGE